MIPFSPLAAFGRALQALQVHQRRVDVATRNMGGAGDPAYTRLEVDRSGAGVAVLRRRDPFLDDRYRLAAARQARTSARAEALDRIEAAFREPGEHGLQARLDAFWAAWRALAADPGNPTRREQALQEADRLATRFRELAGALQAEAGNLTDMLRRQVAEVNAAAAQVAELNRAIARAEATGAEVADLYDQRDRILDQLARAVGATRVDRPGGQVAVLVGGGLLVDGGVVGALAVAADGSLRWADGSPATVQGGTVAGLLQARDQDLPAIAGELDRLAVALADAVNAQHRQGYGQDGVGGRDLFAVDGTAASLRLAPGMDAARLGAAADPTAPPGDGTVAQAVADVATWAGIASPLSPERLLTPGDHYRALVGHVGVVTRSARDTASAAEATALAADRQRQSAWGVSLDEETVALVEAQKAYAAAARAVTALDELLDVIINRMGAAR